MDQTIIDAQPVLTSAQKARRASAKPTIRTAVKKAEPKKVRADGTVKTTLPLDSWIDEQLPALAFAWKCDRSELARQFIASKLMAYDVAEELRKAAPAYSKRPVVESDGDGDRQTGADGVSSDGKKAA